MFRIILTFLVCWSAKSSLANQTQKCVLHEDVSVPLENEYTPVVCKDVETLLDLNKEMQPGWRYVIIENWLRSSFAITAHHALHMDQIEKLDLSRAGALTLSDYGFRDFPALKHLNISNNQLIELKGDYFSSNASLHTLDASRNYIEILTADSVENLKSLKYADFSHNRLTVISTTVFKDMAEVEYLDLSENEISSVGIVGCSKLRTLNLSGNPIKNIFRYSLGNLPALEHLDLSLTDLFSIQENAFETMVSLRVLNLSFNAIEATLPDTVLGLQNTKLVELDLHNNDLKTLLPNNFHKLSTLQILDVSGNSLSSLNEQYFVGLTALRKLYLQDNDIEQIKDDTFQNLNQLDYLDLSRNNLEEIGFNIFGHMTLPRLRKLMLHTNNLKRLHPLAFASLPFLEYLSLAFNELTYLDVRMFAPMRYLKKLHLGHNALAVIPPDVMESWNFVTDLLIDNNKLSFLPDVNATFPALRKVAVEGNPWQCPCLNEIFQWLDDRQVDYVRTKSPHFTGKRPLCVVTPVDFCVRNLKLVEEHEIVHIFESAIESENSTKV